MVENSSTMDVHNFRDLYRLSLVNTNRRWYSKESSDKLDTTFSIKTKVL